MLRPFGFRETVFPPDYELGATGGGTAKASEELPKEPTDTTPDEDTITLEVDGKEEKFDLSDKDNLKNVLQQGRRLAQLREQDKAKIDELRGDFDDQLRRERERVDNLLTQYRPEPTPKKEPDFRNDLGEVDEVAKLRWEGQQRDKRLAEFEQRYKQEDDYRQQMEMARTLNIKLDKLSKDYEFAGTEWGKEYAAIAIGNRFGDSEEMPSDSQIRAVIEETDSGLRERLIKNPPKGLRDAIIKGYNEGKLEDANKTRATKPPTGGITPIPKQKPPTGEEIHKQMKDGTTERELKVFMEQQGISPEEFQVPGGE